MSLHIIRAISFSGNFTANTKIGGVASTLGSPSLIANTIGISIDRIAGFKVIGDDVYLRILGNYSFKASPNSGSIFDSTGITSYYDYDGLVVGNLTANTFRSTGIKNAYFPKVTHLVGLNNNQSGAFRNAQQLEEFYSESLQYVGFYGFYNNIMLESCPTEDIETILLYGFYNCPKMPFDTFSSLTTISQGGQFYNCDESEELHFPLWTNFTDSTNGNFASNSSKLKGVYLDSLETIPAILTNQGFANNPQFETFYAPVAKTFILGNGNPNIANGMFSNSPIPELVLPEMESFTGTFNALKGLSNCDLISMKKCKTFYDPDTTYNIMFLDLKSGCTIQVHEDNLTNNGSGGVNNCLQEAKDLRGATVEFYDDAGNYVTTL